MDQSAESLESHATVLSGARRGLDYCSCGRPVFFANSSCTACGAQLGFDPRLDRIVIMDDSLRRCGNAFTPAACNWVLPAGDDAALCCCCALTRTIPNLENPDNGPLWAKIEAAKRSVVASLLRLGLPLDDLRFDFLQTPPGEPHILTGHSNGLITLNIEEADDACREAVRASFGEPYRTLVGHIRHELGHFYFSRLIQNTPYQTYFRELFGDEQTDYAGALQAYHANGAPSNWQQQFITAYATAHPHEDWAETWAHYLHIRAGLRSAARIRLEVGEGPPECDTFCTDALLFPDAAGSEEFLEDINRWCAITLALNELNRSMGQPDFYPFVLSAPVVQKLQLVHLAVADVSKAGAEHPKE
ncbi:MAG TPA: putative zinc-binding metallopeptidase [Bryobacteraceae bacterium]|nr:putative zinc-binding metallopeptidase [Bryobacteraceae bacterium]